MQTKKIQLWTAFPVILLIFGAAWIWLSRTPGGSTTGGKIPAPQAGFQAPDFTLSSFSGDIYSLSDLRGKPLLINFWASWCPPCRTEMPAMQKVYDDLKEQGFTILAINTTFQDNIGDATTFVQIHQLTFPLLLDMDGRVSSLYEIRSLPTSFFVDAQGNISDVIIGGPMSEALIRIQVEKMLSTGS